MVFLIHTELRCTVNHTSDVEFYSKNEFFKLVHPVGFVIRIYRDARSPERQIKQNVGDHDHNVGVQILNNNHL